MMILSPAIVLKNASRKRQCSNGLIFGALLVFAGLGLVARAACRDAWG